MAFYDKFPYTNFQELNLDWLTQEVSKVRDNRDASDASAAAALASEQAAKASETAAAASQQAAANSETAAAGSEAASAEYLEQIGTHTAGAVADWLRENLTPTTPPVDDTLTIQGAAADAKETGDAIRDLKSAVKYNSFDLVELAHPTGRTHQGVSYTWNGTYCTVNGTATASSFCNILDEAKPEWIIGGNTYHVYYESENVTLAVYEWHNGSMDSTPLINTKANTTFTLSNDVEAVTIRIRVAKGTTANEIVHPVILYALSNKSIEDLSVLSRKYPKKMAVFGDSVLLGRDGNGAPSSIVKKNIPYYIHELTSYEIDNFAEGGMGWISKAENTHIAYDAISSVDLSGYETVLLCFGINDAHEKLGAWNSADESTIMGQVNKCIEYIGTKNPSANIILLAPFITRSGNYPGWSLNTKRDYGWNMQMLSDAQKKSARYHHITFLDQANSPCLGYGINSYIGTDNIHPSADGYKVLGYWISYRINTENNINDNSYPIDELIDYNTFNVASLYRYEDKTSNGITYSYNTDGSIKVTGTASANSFYRVLDERDSVPSWLKIGKSYTIKYRGTNVSLRVYEEINGTLSNAPIIDTTKDAVYQPTNSNLTGIQVRLFVGKGATVNETVSVEILTGTPSGNAYNPPMLTIIDDDGNEKYYTKLLPLIEAKGVPIACALPSGKTYDDGVTAHMSWQQIEDAYKRGAEFLNHSYSHWTYNEANSHTEAELWLDYTKGKNTISSHGIQGGDMLVYGGLSGTLAKAKAAATHASKCAFHSHGDEINYRETLDRWFIKRYGIEDEPYNYDITALKSLIDACAAHGGWMIWMIHTSSGNWTDSIVDVLSDAIDYAIASGVAVVSAECGYYHYIDR